VETSGARHDTVDPAAVRRVVDGDATKSDKIRALNRLGMRTADIARSLDIRYQFARNVLVRDEQRAAPAVLISESERSRVVALTGGLRTKAARIRALFEAGFDRSRIANVLGLSYQHVYSVLSATARRADRVADARPAPANAGPVVYSSRSAAPGAQDDDVLGPDPVRSVVETGGRIVVPASFLEALGVSEGDAVVMAVEGDELRLYGQDAAIRRAQRLVAQYVPADVGLADELIAERRREAARESSDG
jgi:bifunctional DNA-binding transcriptional regulator/antitoxin component of YhaV-PrlF toxin-antitoxin module